MYYTGETWQVVTAWVFVALLFAGVFAVFLDELRRSARVRRAVGGVISAGAMVRRSWAGYVLLFLAVLAALSVMGWMVPEDERDIILAEMEESAARFVEWGEAGNCNCLDGYADIEEVEQEPDDVQYELFQCCLKEFCGTHMERDQDHQWCYCAALYYDWNE